jgi:hypothetical protein
MSITDVGLQQIATGWKDNLSDVTAKTTGAGNPTFATITGAFSGFKFALNDAVWATYHIGHDFKPSSGIYFHVHWLPDGTNVNSVKWQWTYAIAKGHDQSAFPLGSPTVVTAEQTIHNPAAAYRHYITEISSPVTSSELEPDTLIMVQLKRITNGATDNTDNIFALFADVHYQSDRVATLNRAPNFYA